MAVCTPIRTVSICSGIGGLDLGISLAGKYGFGPKTWPVCYIEREAYAAAVLVARMEGKALEKAPIWSDIRCAPLDVLAGHVDAIIGGIPCQPYSAAGKQGGSSDERDLWPYTLRLLIETGADILFIENVSRFRTAKDGLSRVLESLPSGWDAQWGTFSCEGLGAPHRRERLFLLAYHQRGLLRLKQGWSGWEIWAARETEPPIPTRAELAHTCGMGLEERDRSGVTEEARSGRLGPSVADSDSEKRQEGGRSPQESHPVQYLPFWPPTREPERWIGVDPSLWPSSPTASQHELRKLADGLPDWLGEADAFRADELRGLGNAVSPPVGAVAWSVLCARAIARTLSVSGGQ